MRAPMDEAVLIGSNLAMLVAACELGRRGRRVCLVTEGRAPGGFFGGVLLEGHRFDLGMVLLERPAAGGPAPALATYDPRVRNDCARFSAQVEEFIASLVDTVRVATPEADVAGRRFPDYVLCNRTEAFSALVDSPPDHAAAQGRGHPLHASGKFTAPAYEQARYGEAALHNHGAQAQALMFDPFAAKVCGDKDPDLLARFHRMAWLPLYYPETICSAARGAQDLLPEYGFWTTQEGSCAAWIAAAVEEVRRCPTTRIIESALKTVDSSPDGLDLLFGNGERLAARYAGLGTTPERSSELLGLAPPAANDAVSIDLGLFLVRQDAIRRSFSVLMTVEPQYAGYRISDLDACAGRDTGWHRVVAEAGAGAAATPERMQADVTRGLGVPDPSAVRFLKQVNARRSLVLPSHDGMVAAAAHAADLESAAAGRLALTGPLAGVGAASMNDQVVQGLKLAQALA